MPMMPSSVATPTFSSVLILAITARPWYLTANSSTMGAIMRHGPHQGAQKSTITGTGEFNTRSSNVSSETWIGPAGSELSGHAIVTGGVRILTPFFNLYGTIALVGGALWSAFVFFRKRILLHRTLGNVLIAAGAILPAFGGTFSRMGVPNALYIGELLGVIFIFLGYLRATHPMKGAEAETDE